MVRIVQRPEMVVDKWIDKRRKRGGGERERERDDEAEWINGLIDGAWGRRERRMGGVDSEMETESYGLSPLALFSTARANTGTQFIVWFSSSLISQPGLVRIQLNKNYTSRKH